MLSTYLAFLGFSDQVWR